MRKKAFVFAAALWIAAVFFTVKTRVVAFDKLVIAGEKGVYVYDAPEVEFFYAGTTVHGIDDVVDYIAVKEYVAPVDAHYKFFPDDKIKFKKVKHSFGRSVDKVRLKDDILTALSVGGGVIKPVYNTVNPQIYYKDLTEKITVRSKFFTDFSWSSDERKSNILTALKAVNGTVVNSGEQFSFNDTVGSRSEEKGYKTAKIIVDGEFTEGVGGGVCQVSTTLYNAALLAGLKIDEYHPHSLKVSYVESSFDAMVSYGTCDLKFTNDTGAPVYVKAFADGDKAAVIVYGAKMTKTYERESVVTEVISPAITRVYSPLLDENEYIIKTAAKDGIKSEGYLIIRSAGGAVSRKLLRKDAYKPVNGIIETGDKAYETVKTE
ncbi:MAG: VanW family protein [Clostridia bacterium]|nr:VanW family protein [Clostridia bacterium]